MQGQKFKLIISELRWAVAIFMLSGMLGALVTLGILALLEGPLDVLPFWGRRATSIIFPVYTVGTSLVLAVQEFRAGYANRLALREAQRHLGEDARVVASRRRTAEDGAEQLELVVSSMDGRRQVRMTNTRRAEGDPQVLVHFEERQGPEQGYEERRRLQLKYTLLERLVRNDTRYFLAPSRNEASSA